MTQSSVRGWYAGLTHPPGTPPNGVFAPVWTTLYVLIGVAAWLVWRRLDLSWERKRTALRCWGWQLLGNALWPAAFFGLRSPALGMAVMVLLLGAVLLTLRRFLLLNRAAGLLLVPYLGWLAYAAYLNAGVVWLNTGTA